MRSCLRAVFPNEFTEKTAKSNLKKGVLRLRIGVNRMDVKFYFQISQCDDLSLPIMK